MTAIGRLLPVMIKKRAGRIRPKGLVRSNANGRASLCNYPARNSIAAWSPAMPLHAWDGQSPINVVDTTSKTKKREKSYLA